MHDSAQRRQSESYGKIKEAIIVKIQKTFNDSIDLVTSLETNTKKVYAEPQAADPASVGTTEEKTRKDRLAEKKWEILFNRHQDKVDKFNNLWIKAYALIWDNYCSKDLQIALKEMPDYDSVVNKEPLILLERIEQLMHTPERAKYTSLTMVKILSNFLKCRQGEKESLMDYLSRFKSERDTVYQIMGKKFLDGFAESSPEWNDTWPDADKKSFRSKELKKFIAVLFLRNSDYSTYNELLVD